MQLEMELEWAKIKALQAKDVPSLLSLNARAKAIKVLETLVVSERKTNIQLSLELKQTQKEKGTKPNGEATKATET
jgi:hypothetical protein